MQTATRNTRKFRTAALATAVLAALALSACDNTRDDPQTVGQKIDSAVASVEQKSEQSKMDAERAIENGKASTAQAVEDIKDATRDAAQNVADKISDATITTTVNAELARDPKLSALRINVDTVNGNVALRGTAPDSASRDRATQLARNVKGVTNVDNQLTVSSNG